MRDHAKGSGGDGILSVKYFEDGRHAGYDLLHLRRGRSLPFIRRRDNLPPDWDGVAETGPWVFSAAAFRFAEKIFKNNRSEPLYLDEIGPLEIREKSGFYRLAAGLISGGDRELFLSVRESLLGSFIQTFSLTRSQLVIIRLTPKRGSYD